MNVIVLPLSSPELVPTSVARDIVVPDIVHVPKLVSPARGLVVYCPVKALFVLVKLI